MTTNEVEVNLVYDDFAELRHVGDLLEKVRQSYLKMKRAKGAEIFDLTEQERRHLRFLRDEGVI